MRVVYIAGPHRAETPWKASLLLLAAIVGAVVVSKERI